MAHTYEHTHLIWLNMNWMEYPIYYLLLLYKFFIRLLDLIGSEGLSKGLKVQFECRTILFILDFNLGHLTVPPLICWAYFPKECRKWQWTKIFIQIRIVFYSHRQCAPCTVCVLQGEWRVGWVIVNTQVRCGVRWCRVVQGTALLRCGACVHELGSKKKNQKKNM